LFDRKYGFLIFGLGMEERMRKVNMGLGMAARRKNQDMGMIMVGLKVRNKEVVRGRSKKYHDVID